MVKKSLVSFFVFMLLLVWGLAGAAFAHVSNELQVYKDLADSPAKEEITKLRAIGIIPYIEGQENFEPRAELDRETLGSWLAKAANIKGHTENPTPEEFAEEAVEYGYIDNLEGTATYADVVTGLLKIIGVKEVSKPAEQAEDLGAIKGEWHDLVDSGATATRENAVLLFDMFLTTKGPDGKTILDILGVKEGPTGTVDNVIEEKVTVDGQEKEIFSLNINGTQLPFYGEGKIALYENILAAKGNAVVQSYVKTIEEEGKPAQEMIIFIQGDGSAAAKVAPDTEPAATAQEPSTQDNTQEKAQETSAPAEPQASAPQAEVEEETAGVSVGVVWFIVILALLVVGFVIYASGRKRA